MSLPRNLEGIREQQQAKFSMTKAFGIGRCSRCGTFARREDLKTVYLGGATWSTQHKLGPRGGDKCKAIIRKRVWRRKWTTQRKKDEREKAKVIEEILGIKFT